MPNILAYAVKQCISVFIISKYNIDTQVWGEGKAEARTNVYNLFISQRTIPINTSFVAGITSSGLWLCLTIKVSFGCVHPINTSFVHAINRMGYYPTLMMKWFKISNGKYMDKWPNSLTSVWPFTKLFGQFMLFYGSSV